MHAREFSLIASLVLTALPLAAGATRSIPQPLATHPGNVFLAGDAVSVRAPANGPADWRLLDADHHQVATGHVAAATVDLGRLPVGWYELVRGEDEPASSNRVSLAVFARLQAPTPRSSPIALDAAMAWFFPPDQMPAAANLCGLAGINWVRDRLRWDEMETGRGRFAGATRYDASARAQTAAGLRSLQVIHLSPTWANPDAKRFPLNLRDAYRFYREMARRWRGQVEAFEPWNEADIDVFGGHTGAEIATLQKAAWFGLKAGNPDMIVCQNVFAVNQRAILDDFAANQPGAFFDTFNLHHYVPFDAYPKVYADFRAVSAGKPLWVTECSVPVKWSGDEHLKEPGPDDLRLQAERVAKVFACSLHEGATATFYFLLPHYAEGPTQFGILRADLTPRPAFVALAAVGRLLADAKPLGRARSEDAAVRAYLFAARPDGRRREVMVAWSTSHDSQLTLPAQPEAVFDHLGRPQPSPGHMILLHSAPVFALLAPGTGGHIELTRPPTARPRSNAKPCPVVFQALLPADRVLLSQSAFRLATGGPETIRFRAYNFGHHALRGRLRATAPAGWRVKLPATLNLPADAEVEFTATLDGMRATDAPATIVLKLEGDFGSAGTAVLSLRLKPPPSQTAKAVAIAIPAAANAGRWHAATSGGGRTTIEQGTSGVTITAQPATPDRWIYPRLDLQGDERFSDRIRSVAVKLTLIEGDGQFRAVFDETGGSSYIVDLNPQPRLGETVECVARIDEATFGATWSEPDPDARLDLPQVKSLRIGCNTQSNQVRFAIRDLRWLAASPTGASGSL